MIRDRFLAMLSISLGLALVGLSTISVFAAENAPRISKEKFIELLGRPDVIILDVRLSKNWQESEIEYLRLLHAAE